jgi:starch synthase (maltosyl-transferring)
MFSRRDHGPEPAAPYPPLLVDGRRRAVVTHVAPELDDGRYPIKRIVGDQLLVAADLITDGHDQVTGVLLYRHERDGAFVERPLEAIGNDRFVASFALDRLGYWRYTVECWLDAFATWRHGFQRKVEAGQDVGLELREGAALIAQAAQRAPGEDRAALAESARLLGERVRGREEPPGKTSELPLEKKIQLALDPQLAARMRRHPDRRLASRYPRELGVVVDPARARFSAWYELFPRSCGDGKRHGTFADVERRLPYIADLGFDVLYLPPIHPIGTAHRKGRNNSLTAAPDDVGSPWAIGGPAGGHQAIHPELGTLDELRRLVQSARGRGIDIALDIALQASPDHPWVREHPEWFRRRADGTIQYAENPPKKYEDVYPLAFDGEAWQPLWEALKGIFLYWITQGITIFRVDNPHTKPLPFWQWCIAEIKRDHPEIIFLAEAFTRPKLMQELAKIGFTQSYTYFAWRTNKWELTEYMRELTQSEQADYLRPNFWPNTPDILTEQLQFGGRSMFVQRLVLAATLSSNYGIYGPAFELMEHTARPGSEEYIDNEKYQLRAWDLTRPDSLAPLIRRVNRMRHENRALQDNRRLHFHATDNDQVICYSKASDDGNAVLVVVNLDPAHAHGAWVDIDPQALGVGSGESFQVHDLLGEARYLWRAGRNFVQLDPRIMPAHLFRVRRRTASERDFEYYL